MSIAHRTPPSIFHFRWQSDQGAAPPPTTSGWIDGAPWGGQGAGSPQTADGPGPNRHYYGNANFGMARWVEPFLVPETGTITALRLEWRFNNPGSNTPSYASGDGGLISHEILGSRTDRTPDFLTSLGTTAVNNGLGVLCSDGFGHLDFATIQDWPVNGGTGFPGVAGQQLFLAWRNSHPDHPHNYCSNNTHSQIGQGISAMPTDSPYGGPMMGNVCVWEITGGTRSAPIGAWKLARVAGNITLIYANGSRHNLEASEYYVSSGFWQPLTSTTWARQPVRQTVDVTFDGFFARLYKQANGGGLQCRIRRLSDNALLGSGTIPDSAVPLTSIGADLGNSNMPPRWCYADIPTVAVPANTWLRLEMQAISGTYYLKYGSQAPEFNPNLEQSNMANFETTTNAGSSWAPFVDRSYVAIAKMFAVTTNFTGQRTP